MHLEQNCFETFYTDDDVHEVGTLPIGISCRLAFNIADGTGTTRLFLDLTIDDAEQLVHQLNSALEEMREVQND